MYESALVQSCGPSPEPRAAIIMTSGQAPPSRTLWGEAGACVFAASAACVPGAAAAVVEPPAGAAAAVSLGTGMTPVPMAPARMAIRAQAERIMAFRITFPDRKRVGY